MQFTPRVFVSAASSDLSSARQIVMQALIQLECLPLEQTHFGTDSGKVIDVLRQKIASSQAVIHLVGRDYGGEPTTDPGHSRRSWTQIEFDLARELQKNLYLIVCDDTYPFDPCDPEPNEIIALQMQHKKAVLASELVYKPVHNAEELKESVLGFKEQFELTRQKLEEEELRHRRQIWLLSTAVMAVLAAVVFVLLQLGSTINRNADDVAEKVEATGTDVHNALIDARRQQDARLVAQRDQLQGIEVTLRTLERTTHELETRLRIARPADDDSLRPLAERLNEEISSVKREFEDQPMSPAATRVVRNATAVALRAKMQLDSYRVNPPDFLLIELAHNIRPADEPLRSGDLITVDLENGEPISPGPLYETPLEEQIRVAKEIENKYLGQTYVVQANGMLDLGPVYGKVRIKGLTLESAREAIAKHLTQYVTGVDGKPAGLRNPIVSVTMPDITGRQPIGGQHLVAPDGRITLGIYGQLQVAGMSVPEIKQAIEKHLASSIDDPEVSVSVVAYNSMVVYVILTYGDKSAVYKVPYMGRQSVMDVLAAIGGPPGRLERMTLTNPKLPKLEVDWLAISQGDFTTDYKICPDDRLVITLKDEIDFAIPVERPLNSSLQPSTDAQRPSTSPYLNLLNRKE